MRLVSRLPRVFQTVFVVFVTVFSTYAAAHDVGLQMVSLLPTPNQPSPKNTASSGGPYTITLITGDVVQVIPQTSGPFLVQVISTPTPGQEAVYQAVTDSAGDEFIVPAGVRPLLSSILDPTFFNINYLLAHHLTDDQTPYIHAIVQYANGARDHTRWGSSIVGSIDLPSIHSRAITISKKSSAEFGRSLLAPLATKDLAGIVKIWFDKVVTISDDQSTPLIGAAYTRTVLGYNGTGVKIAVIDTGIDTTHPDFFFANGSSKIIINADFECSGQTFNPSQCDGTTHDLFGHGTHVAGIAAGTGAASGGLYIGVAPGASLMNVKALNRFGSGQFSWVIAAMQAASIGINGTKADVISMSLGDGVTDGTDPVSLAVNNLTATTGAIFVIAAGNSGSGEVTVATPGAANSAITVAASTKVEPVSIATFSSRGPRAGDFNIKPDITAPGVSIISTCSSTATALPCPTGSKYLTLSGTSMATPHVSGSVALLLQAARASGLTLTSAQVKNFLQDSSRIIAPAAGQPDVDIYQQGAGLVRIDRAIRSNITFSPAELSFGLVPFNTGASLQGTVQIQNRGSTTQTLSLNWTMTDVPSNLSPLSTGTSYNNLVSVNRTSVTLAPNAAIAVAVTVNAAQAPYQKLYTFFSGRLTATSTTGEQEHAIFGFTKQGPRVTLNITGILPDGTHAAGQAYSILDVNDGNGLHAFFNSLNSNGQAILSVPPATYAVIMSAFLVPPTYQTYKSYRISNFNVVAQNSTTVILDARTAQAVALNLQADAAATAGVEEDNMFSYNPTNFLWTDIDVIVNGIWNFFGENLASPQVGALSCQDRWEVARSPASNSTVLYDLAISRHQFGPTVDTITSGNLTTTTGVNTMNLHADKASTMLIGRESIPAKFYGLGFILVFLYPINAPLTQTQYQQAGESLIRQIIEPGPGSFWFDSPYTYNYFGLVIPGKVWTAGQSTSESFFDQPLHPSLGAVSRTGNTLNLAGYELMDTFGHPGVHVSDRGANFTMNVYVNGVLNFTTSSFPCTAAPGTLPFYPRIPCSTPIAIPLPASTATVKLQMLLTPDSSWTKLAKTSQTNVTFTTSPTSQGPLLSDKYVISGLNLLNQVPSTTTPTTLSFTIPLTTTTGAPFNATTATVQFSTNNGTSWSSASTTISSGLLTVSASVPTPIPLTYVSFLVHAQSADGTTLDQRIILATQIIVTSPPDFAMSASPTSLSIPHRQSGSATITLTTINGFSGTVSLNATVEASPSMCHPIVIPCILPNQPTASLSPTSVTLTSGGSATSTLTIRTVNTTPTGTYTVVVMGTSGSQSHSISITVTVT